LSTVPRDTRGNPMLRALELYFVARNCAKILVKFFDGVKNIDAEYTPARAHFQRSTVRHR
jgi:hypothetical protein